MRPLIFIAEVVLLQKNYSTNACWMRLFPIGSHFPRGFECVAWSSCSHMVFDRFKYILDVVAFLSLVIEHKEGRQIHLTACQPRPTTTTTMINFSETTLPKSNNLSAAATILTRSHPPVQSSRKMGKYCSTFYVFAISFAFVPSVGPSVRVLCLDISEIMTVIN